MRHLPNLILYDIRFSFRQNRIKWLFAAVIQLFLCIRTFDEVSFYAGSYDLLSELWPVMSGAREYLLAEDSSFQLPAYWFLFHAYLFFLVGFYPAAELHLGNGQALIRTCSRKNWIISKWISIIINTVLYYGLYLVLLLAGNMFHGGVLIPGNGIIRLGGIPVFSRSRWDLLAAFVLLPLFMSVALGEMQVVISLFVGPVLAFMAIFGYMIASVFWMHPLLAGSYSMLYRQDWVSGRPVISVATGMLLCPALIIFALAAGILMFQRKDILPAV